jgi:integrase
MALYKRNKIYWIDITHNGARIQRSTGTNDKVAAQELHDKIKADLWRQSKLNEKPKRMWMEAAIRWIHESSHKRSLNDDKIHLRWLNDYLKDLSLDEVDRAVIKALIDAKAGAGASNARINRMLAVVRAILNRAANDWEWLDQSPRFKLLKEENHRIRWLSQDQAEKLINELPDHLSDMATFSLATGLRQSNVKNLKWEDVNLKTQHGWIHADEAKTSKAIAVPLNETAIAVLEKRRKLHSVFVFTFRGKPVKQVNTKAWKKALKRAGIENFRWHDLRHTWASWHVQNGTSLQELQQLGGWSSFSMVLRYAHLSSEHLRNAASRVCVTNSLHQETKNENREMEYSATC